MSNLIRIFYALSPVFLLTGCSQNQAKTIVADTGGRAVATREGLQITAAQMLTLKLAPAILETLSAVDEATGKVAFNEDAMTSIYSPYAGRILEIPAKPGELVAKGSPLLVIDSPELVPAEADFLTARAGLDKNRALLDQAERTRDRVQKLVAGEAAAPKDLEQAQTELQTAMTELRAAETQLESSRQRLFSFGKTEAEIDRLGETRHVDRVARVIAPIGGLVVSRKVGPGQYVRPDNPDPLLVLADVSTMWLLGQLYESEAARVRVGEKVDVKVLALPDQAFPARVAFIAPAVDPVTRRVAVRCAVPNRNAQLKPEMFASFRFEKAPRRALLVPEKAVVREGNLAVVWVADGKTHIFRRQVDTGTVANGRIEIRSGLTEGETVVADGALFLSSFAKDQAD